MRQMIYYKYFLSDYKDKYGTLNFQTFIVLISNLFKNEIRFGQNPSKKGFKSPKGVTNFGAISLNQIPNDDSSITEII